MTKPIKLSIIIPFYNGQKYFPILIGSLKQAILMSGHKFNFELITVIDSMLTDRYLLLQLVEFFFKDLPNCSVIVTKNSENIGVAASRNTGIALSSGDFLHFIDQDDAIDDSFYSRLSLFLKDNCFILTNGLVKYSNAKFNSHKLYYIKPDLSLVGLLKGDYIRSPGQVVFSKKLLKGILFPEPKQYKGADDRFFWIRLFMENQGILLPYYVKEPVYIAHIHDENYSSDTYNLKKSQLENWTILLKDQPIDPYQRLIRHDILRIKSLLKEPLTLYEKAKGWFFVMIYFLEPNKIVRFLIKRAK